MKYHESKPFNNILYCFFKMICAITQYLSIFVCLPPDLLSFTFMDVVILFFYKLSFSLVILTQFMKIKIELLNINLTIMLVV